MVDELHANECAEPWRWSFLEELVVVGIDVELTELRKDIGLKERR